jgi:Glyoxalase-like domain
MNRTMFDHLAVVAPTLERGVAWVEERLGVAMGPGGAHPKMGTHNRLLALSDSSFLEVIAIDPAAPAPGRARWFGLDRLAPGALPRLATWVVNTSDVRGIVAASPEDHGVIEAVTRGTLSWLLTVPGDGSLPLGGAAPAVIEWEAGPHPAARMTAAGCALRRLDVHHPEPERIAALLSAIGFDDDRVRICEGEARLVAHLDTPKGIRVLGADPT